MLSPLVGRLAGVESLGGSEEFGAGGVWIGSIPGYSGIVEAGFELRGLKGGIPEAGRGWGSGGSLWFTIGIAEAVGCKRDD